LHIRRLHLQHNTEFLRKKLCPWGLIGIGAKN
jgi:hypothetical protein